MNPTVRHRVDVGRLQRARLACLRAVLIEADCAGAVFLDPINIRYATDITNMQVWRDSTGVNSTQRLKPRFCARP